MATTHTASKSRTGDDTQAKRCDSCGKAFWSKSSWNRVQVKCPWCSRIH